MIQLVALKALAGFNYIRPDLVVAISATEPTKCVVMMNGGFTVPCAEPAKDVIAKLEAALQEKKE
jgi:hypothetical protein